MRPNLRSKGSRIFVDGGGVGGDDIQIIKRLLMLSTCRPNMTLRREMKLFLNSAYSYGHGDV